MLRPYLLALSFLTVLPIKMTDRASEKEMSRSLAAYPLVGLTLGLLLALMVWGSYRLQLGFAGDVLAVVTLIILTGGLHLDGLMDTADGMLSGKPREQKLEIMKDSRVGAMGVVAAISVILLKVALLSALPFPQKLFYLIVMPSVGRWSFVYAISNFPYARATPGLGSSFGKNNGQGNLIAATAVLLLGAAALTGWPGMISTAASIIFTWVLLKNLAKSLGGLTGDTYGAAGEMTETWYLLITAILFGLGVS